MTTPREVAIESELAVRWIVARYCHLIDDRDFNAAADLFTEDARFRVLDQDLHGRNAIREWMDTIPKSMFHQVSNVVVSNGSKPGSLHAVSDLAAGSQSEGRWAIGAIGRYHDTFAGEGRGIRFTQRIITLR
jgi:ketosteroid isomerase-like protein